MRFKKTLVASAVAGAIGLGGTTTPETASADILQTSWTGLMTLLDPAGRALQNESYYYDPTWGYGFRTPISGTLTMDTTTGSGSATIAPFELLYASPDSYFRPKNIAVQAIGDGNGGYGPYVQFAMQYDWGSAYNVNVDLIMDASGFFSAGPYTTSQTIDGTAPGSALPASDGIRKGTLPIGPVPVATTTYDSAFPLSGDGIGGIPMTAGPFTGFNFNFDITSLHVDPVYYALVPLPPALWLFGTGLLGVLTAARRKRG